MMTIVWRRPRRSRCCVVATVCALSVSLIALITLYCSLPVILRETDARHLVKVMVQHQNFIGPEETQVILDSRPHPDPPELTKLLKQQEAALAWLQNMSANAADLGQQEETRPFQLGLTARQRALQLWTLEVFIRVCREAGLTYILVEGTMLGVYRHHGFVPWDDDIDVAMNGSDWRHVHDVLSRVPGFGLYAPRNVQWKFFPLGGTPMAAGPFTYPYVDIFFFTEDDTHLWALTWALKPRFLHKKSDIFPLQLRPFEHLMVHVPCDLAGVVRRRYDVEWCQTNLYDHRNGRDLPRVHRLPCARLHPTLPFVFRQTHASMRTTTEVLKVGDRVLRNFTVPDYKCGSVPTAMSRGAS